MSSNDEPKSWNLTQETYFIMSFNASDSAKADKLFLKV